jgi:hypothetical protein
MSTEKVSLSLPADLLAEARERAEDGNLSAYVADGLRRRVLADRQRVYLAELDDEFGPLTEDELARARRLWQDEA